MINFVLRVASTIHLGGSEHFVNFSFAAKPITDFIDTRPSNKNSREHLAIRFRQSCAPCMVLQECRSCFQKYGGPCVACSVDMVASYPSSLRWRVVYLLVQGLSASAIARLLHMGLTFVKKIRKIDINTSTVDYPTRTGKARQMDGR